MIQTLTLCDRCGDPITDEQAKTTVAQTQTLGRDEYHFHSRRCYTSWMSDSVQSLIGVYGEIELDEGPGHPVQWDEFGQPIITTTKG